MEATLVIVPIGKGILPMTLLRAIHKVALVYIAFVVVVIGAEAMLSVIQPITNITVVVRVDILAFATFNSLLNLSLIFLTVAEEVDPISL